MLFRVRISSVFPQSKDWKDSVSGRSPISLILKANFFKVCAKASRLYSKTCKYTHKTIEKTMVGIVK